MPVACAPASRCGVVPLVPPSHRATGLSWSWGTRAVALCNGSHGLLQPLTCPVRVVGLVQAEQRPPVGAVLPGHVLPDT